MSSQVNPIRQLVQTAIERGTPPEAKEIRALRARSQQAVTICKTVFWVGIAIFNVALWVPLPFQVDKTLLTVIAVVALAVAVIVPVLGLKRHQMNLELLKTAPQGIKKKTASESGRVYIDQVKKLGRSFIAAEVELLDGSKWGARPDAE